MSILVAKEEIPDLKVIPAFVDESTRWLRELTYAARLGNEFKGKTRITFETTKGPSTVETTVWSVTENFLQLKGGLCIPLNSIIDLQF